MMAQDLDSTFTKNTACYFKEAEDFTGDHPGISQDQVFEALLWQSLLNLTMLDRLSNAPRVNFSPPHNISDAYGAYNWRALFIGQFPNANGTNLTTKLPLNPMSATGVQCKASSNVGTADIDGVTSSYSNSARTDTPMNNQTQRCAQRLGAQVPSLVMPKFGEKWSSSLFTSAAAAPPLYAPYTDDGSDIDSGTSFMAQMSYLQAEKLRQSMLRAYAAYVVQLMYNGGQGFTMRDGSHIGF